MHYVIHNCMRHATILLMLFLPNKLICHVTHNNTQRKAQRGEINPLKVLYTSNPENGVNILPANNYFLAVLGII